VRAPNASARQRDNVNATFGDGAHSFQIDAAARFGKRTFVDNL
jgi:hypothetical protein